MAEINGKRVVHHYVDNAELLKIVQAQNPKAGFTKVVDKKAFKNHVTVSVI